MDRKGWMARSLTVAMAATVVACAKKEEETQANIEVTAEPAPPPITIDLVPASGAAVMGTVTAQHEADEVNVKVALSGLTLDKDYDAKMRYGDCTIAPQFVKEVTPDLDSMPAAGADKEHKLGDDFLTIRLDKEGTNATGEVTVDNDMLGADEPAFVVISMDDGLVACADLKGHGAMGGTGAAPTVAPGTTPAEPAK